MVVLNYTGGEINAKIVYYGPGLSGKTTNLEFIHEKTPVDSRGKMVSMKTQTDRTLFFDFLPLELGEIGGFRTRFLLYTVPGQVYYNATRKLVLKGVDAIVFVADSSRSKLDENLESLRNLEQNLNEHGLSLDELPWVIQYNKRDAADALTVRDLDARLNPLRVATYEAVATQGVGVYETFHGIATLMYRVLKERLERGELEADAGGRSVAAVSVSAPTRAAAPAPAGAQTSADAGGREGEIELDSAIDSMLREVDSAPRPTRTATAAKEEKAVAAPARAARPPERPAPPPPPPRSVPPAAPAGGGAPVVPPDRRPAPPSPGATPARTRDVNATVSAGGSPVAAPRRAESSSADDSLFEAVPEGSFDLNLGRLPALEEAVFASDHAREQGPDEFVTDPMRRHPRPERPADPPPPVTEPAPITIPVVLKRSQFAAGAVRITLTVRLQDD